jgi:peptidoglycan/LPS O-acetylase OafA/YrhL
MTPRYRSLDAWRGVACLLVILYHSTLFWSAQHATPDSSLLGRGATSVIRAMSYGNVGVALFFVISGYCIAAACESVRTGRHAVSQYFFRRFRRIYPPLWVVIGLSVGFFIVVDVIVWPRLLSTDPWMQPRPWWYSGSQWVGNLTLTESWRYHVAGGPRGHFPGQAWTLCYEEQFYAVTGLLLAISRRRFFEAVTLMTAAVLATTVALHSWHLNADGFFFDGQWILFAAGITVYWALAADQWPHGRTRGTVLLVALVTLSLSLDVQIGYLPIAFAFAILLIPLNRFDNALANAKWSRPLIFCGEMCYSLYLVHQLIARAVAAASWDLGLRSAVGTILVVVPVSLVLSLIAGRSCYLLVERRFINTRPIAFDRSNPASSQEQPLSRLSVS